MEVYVDILLFINLTVNYFLLLCTEKLCGRKTGKFRMFTGAFAGALYSLVIFIPEPGPFLLLLSKLLTAALMVEIAFPHVSVRQSLREYLVFFGVNFLFGGCMLALWLTAAPDGMVFSDGVLYFHITPLTLILSALGAYLVVELLGRFRKKTPQHRQICPVRICLEGETVCLRGLVDTANELRDISTGTPVAVCSWRDIRPACPAGLVRLVEGVFSECGPGPEATENMRGFRAIPYHSLGKRGVIPAFFPDGFYLCREGCWQKAERVLLGVSDERVSSGEYQMLLSPGIDTVICRRRGKAVSGKGKQNEIIAKKAASVAAAVAKAPGEDTAGAECLLYQRAGDPAASAEPRGGKGGVPQAGGTGSGCQTDTDRT